MIMKDQSIAKRLQEICSDYYETYMETPPIPVSSMERMNSLLGGTRKPTVEELLAIFIPILPAVSIYYKDVKRKAQQDMINANQHLQPNTLPLISRRLRG